MSLFFLLLCMIVCFKHIVALGVFVIVSSIHAGGGTLRVMGEGALYNDDAFKDY